MKDVGNRIFKAEKKNLRIARIRPQLRHAPLSSRRLQRV